LVCNILLLKFGSEIIVSTGTIGQCTVCHFLFVEELCGALLELRLLLHVAVRCGRHAAEVCLCAYGCLIAAEAVAGGRRSSKLPVLFYLRSWLVHQSNQWFLALRRSR
jgi:hypothetical protein